MFRIYRAWTDSNHKIVYTLGFFSEKRDAEQILEAICGDRGAADPTYGIDEIEVTEPKDRAVNRIRE